MKENLIVLNIVQKKITNFIVLINCTKKMKKNEKEKKKKNLE